MAAPQLSEAYIKNPTIVVLSFDQPLDDSVALIPTTFSINYGRIPITSVEYYGTAEILLNLTQAAKPKDKLEVNYQPPDDVADAIRGTVPENPSQVLMRRAAIRAFFKVPIKNQLSPNEANWQQMSNLGSGHALFPDIDSPDGTGEIWSGEICGQEVTIDADGNVIIGGQVETGEPGEPIERPIPDGQDGGTAPMGGNTRSGNTIQTATGPYPKPSRPNPRSATPDDFVMAYGLREAIQLTNIDDADATQPNTEKLWMAIQDATALIDNYITQATRAGSLLISSNRRRTALIIARYYLDTVRRREDVKNDYESAIKELDKNRGLSDLARPDLPAWLDPCNPLRGQGVRSHRIPQYYNGVSGKGLSGWWSDSGHSEEDDWRYDTYNAESNNDEQNWNPRGGAARRVPEQPADDGGTQENTP